MYFSVVAKIYVSLVWIVICCGSKYDIETGMNLDKNKLNELGFIKKIDKPAKLLGKGPLNKKITIQVEMVSFGAAEAVKKAGGKVVKIDLESL